MRIITILLCLSISLNTLAQDYKFGKVSKEELEETYNPIDSAASATYLYKHRKTFYEYHQNEGFVLVTEIHERIKIYTQEGFGYATKSINLYKNGSDNEEVNGLKGYTYSLEKGKIVEAKLDKKGIFKTEKSKYRNEVKFTMPNIKEACVLEYKFRMQSPFIYNVNEYVFQHDIPIKKIEASFEAPEYFSFKLNSKGFLAIKPMTETKRDKITFTSKTRTGGNLNSAARTTFNSDDLEFTKNITSYNLADIPALKDEPHVNNIDNYRASIKYELSYTNYPSSPIKYYSTTWEDVVKKIYESSSFGGELDKNGYFDDDIDALISSISDPTKRMALIFNHVKSKVKWNDYYGYRTIDGVRKAYKDQVGSVAEINLMLTAMLQYAGLKAYPVLVSTRGNGIPIFPTREGYDYVVTCVKLKSGDVLLDASNKYSAPNILPFRTLNWQGRIVSEFGGSELIDLYPKKASKNAITMMVNLDEEGNLEGGYRSIKTNHRALSFRERYIEANKDDYLEKLENDYGGLEISEYKVKNELDLAKPILESYKFYMESQADVIGDKLYFSPLFFLRTDENPFKLEKREFPVDFGYPSLTSFHVIINIPDGYQIESLPEPSAMALPDNLGEFKYNISGTGNAVQVAISTKINQSIITPSYYDALKEYFNRFIQKEAEQIVLTKV